MMLHYTFACHFDDELLQLSQTSQSRLW